MCVYTHINQSKLNVNNQKSDNYVTVFRGALGAKHRESLALVPVQPAGQLLHLASSEAISEDPLCKKHVLINYG